MIRILLFALYARWAAATLHHLFVGTVDGGSLYVLELDDISRSLTVLRNESAAGASPSIAFDRSQLFLFGSRPSDGTISRYSVAPAPDFSLKHEGTADIPESCNTTKFTNIKISSNSVRSPNLIYGSASTGTCSTLFSVSVSGFHTLRSNEIAGDIRSFAWSPDGRHLHALDTQSGSLLNFNIAVEDPNLQDLLDTKTIADTKAARQIVTHPVGHRLYVITRDSNELIDIPLLANDRVDGPVAANRSAILVKGTPDGQYVTTSLAISSSNATLWTLSHTGAPDNTFIVTAFRLDPATGAVQNRVARASFKNYLGDGSVATSSLIPAPFEGDMIAVTTYPGAMVAVMGLVGESIKAYGRAMLAQDEGCCGEGVWLK